MGVSYRMAKNPTPVSAGPKIIMQGIHLELTDALRGTIDEKFSRLLRRNEEIVRINVRLHRDQKLGHENHYTVTTQIEIGGPDLIATAEGKEAYDVLDRVVEKLDKLLRERHDRRKEKRNHPHEIELEADLPKIDPGN